MVMRCTSADGTTILDGSRYHGHHAALIMRTREGWLLVEIEKTGELYLLLPGEHDGVGFYTWS